MRKLSLVVSALFLTLSAAVALGQTVRVNWHVHAPFGDYHTYAWADAKDKGPAFYTQWVRHDVDGEMTSKGLRQVAANQHPDLYVYYHMVTQDYIGTRTTYGGFGWGDDEWGSWGGDDDMGDMGMGQGMPRTRAVPRMMGILTVDLIDVSHKQLVWRGQATTDVVSTTQKGDEQQVFKSIEKMFTQFPPKKQ